MKIVIVGAGNVGWVLGRKIKESGHDIMMVVSRRQESADELARVLHAKAGTAIGRVPADCDLCLLAVTDQHIALAAKQLPAIKGIVAHTAGSAERDALKGNATHYGVVYPLQSLNRHLDALPEVPVLIDGNTEAVRHHLADFARTWSSLVDFAADEKRMTIHVAAVIVNNFTNHLMALTEDLCKREGVRFDLLLPLVQQTIDRLGALPAAQLQTGPAVRNDIATIEKHLQLLNKMPALRNLYLKLTESIINQNKAQFLNN